MIGYVLILTQKTMENPLNMRTLASISKKDKIFYKKGFTFKSKKSNIIAVRREGVTIITQELPY